MVEVMIYDLTTGVEVFKGECEERKDGSPKLPEGLEIVEEDMYKVCYCFRTSGADFIG